MRLEGMNVILKGDSPHLASVSTEGISFEVATTAIGNRCCHEVLPKRWIVERTFAWWNCYRRLSKDYVLTEMSQAMIYAAMIHLMLRRLSKLQVQT